MERLSPFHLAIPVNDLAAAKDFYENTLGCQPGRSSDQWADYSLFGHQLVLHEDKAYKGHKHFNEVDGKAVPVPHFGVVLDWDVFHAFSQNLVKQKVEFQIAPYLRFEGLPGEQLTMFFYDPSGNALEFKVLNTTTNFLPRDESTTHFFQPTVRHGFCPEVQKRIENTTRFLRGLAL